MHLNAALSIFQKGHEKDLAPFGLVELSRMIVCENRPLLEHENLVVEQVASFRFLSGTIVWLDVTSSITAGRAPLLLPYHTRIIACDSQIRLQGIMGCQNWVMLQIGRIAALHEQKITALRQQQQHFDCTGFKHTVGDLSRQIQCGLAQLALEAFKIYERDSNVRFEPVSDPPTLVTHVHAYMASVYLHLVTKGFQELDVLDTAMSEVMEMLRTAIPTEILPALVLPLYVIGSVARQEDKEFFRDVFSSPPLLDPSLKHRGRILPIIEEIWNKRQTAPLLAWEDSVELTQDILLV